LIFLQKQPVGTAGTVSTYGECIDFSWLGDLSIASG
jgi:hypothetical protein